MGRPEFASPTHPRQKRALLVHIGIMLFIANSTVQRHVNLRITSASPKFHALVLLLPDILQASNVLSIVQKSEVQHMTLIAWLVQ